MVAPTGLKTEFMKFGETVSVRGISKILKSDVKFLQIFWLFAVLASSAILIWQISAVFIKFYSYPVATTLSNSRHATSFPDITFCNLYPVGETINPNLTWKTYLDKVDAARSSISMADLADTFPDKVITRDIFNGLWESLESSSIYFTNFPIYSGNPIGLPSILADCRYYAWDATESMVQCVNSIKTISNAKFFKCNTMHLNDTFTEKVRSLALIFYINNFPAVADNFMSVDPSRPRARGMRVIIHSPGTRPHSDDGFDVGPGTDTTIKIVPTKRTRLDKPYDPDGCTSQPYLDGSTDLYTTNACVQICFQEQILSQCNCLSNSYKYSPAQLARANSTKCGNMSLLNHAYISTSNPTGLRQLVCLASMKLNYDKCNMQCSLPCVENIYEYSYGVAPWPHLSHQLAFYRQYIKNKTQVYQNRFDQYINIDIAERNRSLPRSMILDELLNVNLIEKNFLKVNFIQKYMTPYTMTDQAQMTGETMLSNIGGSLSLWLGITVMTLAEIAEFAYSIFLFFYEKTKSRSSSVIHVNVCESQSSSPDSMC